MTQILGVLLKQYRLRVGLTQEQLAEQAGTSLRALQYIERGTRLPYADTVQRLATALCLTTRERASLLSSRTASPVPIPPADPSAPLVGRSREIALLGPYLHNQGPPVLLFAGPPGIGKSRLLGEAAYQAGDQGWCVLAGGCTRTAGRQSFAPLLQSLQRHLAGRSAAERRLDLRRCAWLIRLLPELAAGEIEPLPNWMLPPEQERRLMFDAVRQFLDNVAGHSGTLLILDDLQWADVDALDLLGTLLRSTSPMPLRVLGAYRSTEAETASPISQLLVELAEAGLVTHRHLEPLAGLEAKELLRTLLVDTVPDLSSLDQVIRRVGGVPFYLISYARGSIQGNDDEIRRDVPWDVRQSIRGRIQVLSQTARHVLALAAIAGGVILRSTMQTAAEQPEETVLTALEAACRAGLLEEVDEDSYGLVHDVIREVMEGELGNGRRRMLHRRLALALAAQPGDPPIEALANHFRQSGDREQAVGYLEQAGDRATARYAYAAAETWYSALVDCLDTLGRGAEATHAREKLGGALLLLARYGPALAVMEQASSRYLFSADIEGHRRVMARIGHTHAVRGTVADGLSLIQPLLKNDIAPDSSPALAALYVAAAHLYYESGRFAEQLAAAEHAITLARDLKDDVVLAAALGRRGLALANLGRFEEGIRALIEAVRLAEAIGDLENLCQALVHLGNLYLRGGDSARGRPYFERALILAEQLGDPALLILILHFQSWFNTCTGEWGIARRHLDRAMDLSRHVAPSTAVARSLLQLGSLCTIEGDWPAASRHIENAVSLLEGKSDRHVLQWATTLSAYQDRLAGHPAVSLNRLLGAFPSSDPADAAPAEDLAECYLALGDVARAETLAVQSVVLSRARGDRVDLVWALRIQAQVAIRKQDYESAAAGLEEGLSLARATPDPYAEGCLLHVYGSLHAQQDEVTEAGTRLQAALAIFQRLGARKDIEWTEQALIDLGQ